MRAILFAAALCGLLFVAPTARADGPAIQLLSNAPVNVPVTNVSWRGYARAYGGWGGYGGYGYYPRYYGGYYGGWGGYRPYYSGYRGYGYGSYYGPGVGFYYGW